MAAIVPAVAVKLADVLPTGTATEAGTVREDELLERATVAPVVLERVTVQVEAALEARLVGLQVTPVRDGAGAVREMAAICVAPLSVAVMVAD